MENLDTCLENILDSKLNVTWYNCTYIPRYKNNRTSALTRVTWVLQCKESITSQNSIRETGNRRGQGGGNGIKRDIMELLVNNSLLYLHFC